MDPLTLAVAAGGYVAAELAKKSADSVISAAYKRIESYVVGKLRLAKHVEDADPETMRRSGLANDPVLIAFGAEVLAQSSALRRAQLVESVIRGARVLWVDDEPINNHGECRLLEALGVRVRQVRSTSEATTSLGEGSWDLILSDMARGSVPDAGLQMLARLPTGSPPVVLYVGTVGQSRPIPLGAFGIADRPEPLLHLVLDVLERRRI